MSMISAPEPPFNITVMAIDQNKRRFGVELREVTPDTVEVYVSEAGKALRRYFTEHASDTQDYTLEEKTSEHPQSAS